MSNPHPSIILKLGDLLEGGSTAIAMAIDDQAPGMGGAIARRFEREFPDVWEEIEQDIQYGIGLGRSQIIEVTAELDCPFSFIIFCSTLHHLDVIDKAGRLEILRSALKETLSLAANRGVTSIGTAVMVGGWRLSLEDAALEMASSYFSLAEVRPLPTLEIYALDQKSLDRLTACFESSFLVTEQPIGRIIQRS